jgi:hypothetical protein
LEFLEYAGIPEEKRPSYAKLLFERGVTALPLLKLIHKTPDFFKGTGITETDVNAIISESHYWADGSKFI